MLAVGAQCGPQLVGSEDLTGDRERGEVADHARQVRPAELDDRGRVAVGAQDPDTVRGTTLAASSTDRPRRTRALTA